VSATRSSKPLRLTHLRLDNWRNFTRVDVDLARRVIVVGPNASGKSNLLDVVRFLRDVASVGGGLQAAIHARGGVSRLRSLSARRYPDVAIAVAVGTDDEPTLWHYELAFSQDNRQRPFLKREFVTHNGEVLVDRPEREDRDDPARLAQTALEQVNVNRQFREVVSFFESVRYLHIVPQLVREPDRSTGRKNDPFGGDFLEQVAQTTPGTRTARLRRIREALSVAVPQLVELDLIRDERGLPHLRGRYAHWRPGAGWQTEDQFSDGTIRLMGLLWALLDGYGPLLLEEPELSLHPEVIRYIPQMLARIQRRQGRQVLMSTHSTELLTDSGIGLNEVLVLRPTREGTDASLAGRFNEIADLLHGGVSLAEAVIPWTRPQGAEQLPLFAD
jgi:predicted ATPase